MESEPGATGGAPRSMKLGSDTGVPTPQEVRGEALSLLIKLPLLCLLPVVKFLPCCFLKRATHRMGLILSFV